MIDENGGLIYTLKAKLKGNMCLVIPSGSFCQDIKYEIFDAENNQLEGEIRHLYYGIFNEVCTKAD